MPRTPFFESSTSKARTDANSLRQSSIDYMIAAYGPYAASATGGNDLARDFLAGIAALYSTPCKSCVFSLSPFTAPKLKGKEKC